MLKFPAAAVLEIAAIKTEVKNGDMWGALEGLSFQK